MQNGAVLERLQEEGIERTQKFHIQIDMLKTQLFGFDDV